ncbi:MAG TPA: hypothetical protein VKC64_11570 [Burkholderiales bacterium]|nr:hypothetical protein [Burkholderiales bacterium]
MDRRTVLTKTAKGLMEVTGKTSLLPRDLRNVLSQVDGKATVGDLHQKLDKFTEAKLLEALARLARDGFVREFVSAPASISPPSQVPIVHEDVDLDFSALISKPPTKAEVTAQTKAEADEVARQVAEARAKEGGAAPARAEAEARAKREAEDRAKREAAARKEADEKARREAEARAKREAEDRAKREAEERARKEVEEKTRREAEARAKREAEDRAKREAEERSRKEAEEKARREAEARAKREAEERSRKEAEEKARREAEARAKREAEERSRREAEEKTRREAEARAKREAEERSRKEAEEKTRREAEARAKREAEERARKEAEERSKREAEEHARKEAEESARRALEEMSRQAEARAVQELEERTRREAEARARQEAEASARREAEERARRESEERARYEAEERRHREQEDRIRQELEERVRHAEMQARREAEERAERESQERSRREAAERSRREADERARRDAEERSQREAEERSRREAEERAQREAQEQERVEAAEVAQRREEEERVRREAERRVRDEEKARAKAEAEAAARARREERAREKAETDARAKAREKEQAKETAQVVQRLEKIKAGKKSNVGKLAGIALVVAIAAGLAYLQFFMPLDLAEYERLASASLGQPVKIKLGNISVFPSPAVRFENVAIGKDGNVRIAVASAHPDFLSVIGDRPQLKSLELQGVVVDATGLAAILFGRPQNGALGIEQVHATGVKLAMPGVNLPELEATATLDADGSARKIVIHNPTKTLAAEIQPSGGKAIVEMQLGGAKGLLGLPFEMDSLTAKGTVTATEFNATDFDARLLDGLARGKGTLRWPGPLVFDGSFELKQIDARKVTPILAGRIQGVGVLAARGESLDALAAAARLDGNFSVMKGQIAGVDLPRTLQSGKSVPGSTNFNEISATAQLEQGRLALRGVKIDAGALSASGTIDVDGAKSIAGRIAADMKTPAGAMRASLVVSGSASQLNVKR